ncbi:phosphoenolpyruvate synthase [bacterium (Candidatus Blackallbacteria) CG17_big_fil_post_rev_8_21_14_2_50_48_46]|uniref:Phosphoenolpyruvate synthase n=1 Tax=bacterium (Candidatus Blackallbacteria) CG17_big_fil_post_rev_8_21_14_2_50_48_46 TaxID=2014261 RepID=A0A2M7G4H5_9BACT|nr:MAG: phosphoenolpyruvate synthase [bacterium (Candidatus Blackallbacteria) CG18_big_fil_WC_8_21_14_2_50_49_26]PIW16825.1 MAG: phosphoenolpyruvate synthase [bacterium (Candidatus Blackallbacteria) CG17_big_fil_post_rev_8_21_14_2_50_48_46]PIW48022.1 MAG: phosphoenolpyruvate synthase [bacterium (Candidatus Blackallbacteria) CG13_big_fil_rev_8_21_14_2_50_49_14]
MTSYIRFYDTLSLNDLPLVGGKNASLGEMIRLLSKKNIRVPNGFATTVAAYQEFLNFNQLETKMKACIEAFRQEEVSLEKTGKAIRNLFLNTDFRPEFIQAVKAAYQELSQKYGQDSVDVAVRSSATAEDLPDASFAGQQETFLNITGLGGILDAIRKCYASLFTDRAIAYREKQGYDHLEVSLSVGIQKMVRSDQASSGVLFTLDTETGFPKVIVITGAWGLGECVVQGMVTPDEFIVFKPLLEEEKTHPLISKKMGHKHKKMIYALGGVGTTQIVDTSLAEKTSYCLSEEDILKLARWAHTIEKHYNRPMDIEWAKDGETGELFIVQARPETVQSQKTAHMLKTYELLDAAAPIVTGLSIGDAIATGRVCLIRSVEDIEQFVPGSLLVTEMTDPDWVPIMSKAAGIITDQGGRTCHAAIVSRELGVPAVVGTGNATRILKHEQLVTLSCAQGDQGFVYDGILQFQENEVELTNIPRTKTRIMLNIANPDMAFRWWRLPSDGIGLARMEFIINNAIKIHPNALVHYDSLEEDETRKIIQQMTRGYADKKRYFIDQLAYGVAKIAASQYPRQVIVRMSDFKTNEYANLIGGQAYEPIEENPMLGFRGASRYYSEEYKQGFSLECQAIRKVREEMGFKNISIMIPFCRTLDEADKIHEVLAENGLKRGLEELQVYMMCEVPSNVILAEKFATRFDGFSIGSNDLTQLTLGVDRDSGKLANLFDERNEAVQIMIQTVIEKAHQAGIKVGLCGQGPSDYPDFALFLVKAGIDSMSLNPDSFVDVVQRVAALEAE